MIPGESPGQQHGSKMARGQTAVGKGKRRSAILPGMAEMSSNAVLRESRAALVRRGKLLQYFTIGWNSLEGIAAIAAGAMAGSVSLVGFGFDSLIEVTSGAAALWRVAGDADEAARERVEQRSLRIVGACFLALAGYVLYESAASLWLRNAPERSLFGIGIAVASLLAMPLLARAKRAVGVGLGSAAIVADSRQTDFCVYLSAILLAGLLLNAALGWWWADPVAALVMLPLIVKEGVEALRGKTCCPC